MITDALEDVPADQCTKDSPILGSVLTTKTRQAPVEGHGRHMEHSSLNTLGQLVHNTLVYNGPWCTL